MIKRFGKICAVLVAVSVVITANMQVYAFTAIDSANVLIDYEEYSADSEKKLSETTVLLDAENHSNCVGCVVAKETDGTRFFDIDKSGKVEWVFSALKKSNYNLKIRYRQKEGEKVNPAVSVYINGEIPFDEVSTYELTRLFSDDVVGDMFEEDSQGNDIVPAVKEKIIWQTVCLRNSENEAYVFDFNAGFNTLEICVEQGAIEIESVELFAENEVKPYEKPLIENEQPKETVIKLQAEKSLYRTEKSVIPQSDNSSPSTEPTKGIGKKSLNYINGEKWSTPGSAITWSFYVRETGYYKVNLKCRQRYKSDLFVSRCLLIDGETPCLETSKLKFFYSSDWENYILGDGDEAYLFYLEEGNHTITLEAVLGSLGETVSEVEDILLNLNRIYQDILVIAGNSPDTYRDYNFDVLIPDSLENMGIQAERLKAVSAKLSDITGRAGTNTALLDRIALQLEEMMKKPRDIASRFSAYKDNIGSLGTWIVDAKDQGLDLDYILISSPEYELDKAESSFMKKLWFEIEKFIYSFSEDYTVEKENENSVEVWLATGRDQMNTLKKVIDSYFTPTYKINTELKLVQTGALLPAISAGGGPDVYVQANYTDAINYAMRSATVDLTEFDEFDEVVSRFDESAMVPLRYGDGVYALPETQEFLMMFYRTDILSELGLGVPETWDEILQALQILQTNNMEFALPISTTALPEQGVSAFYMFLLQNGGGVFNDELSASELSSDVSVKSFKQWTDFYVNYNLSQTYDAANRFRTGQTPLLIANYTLYNQLQVSAPEIKNLWSFCPVPGTVQSDGSIDHSVASTGLCCMILSNSSNKKNAWEFIRWWTSAEVQASYGTEIENVLGSSARYSTANIEALEELPWSSEDYAKLLEQRKYLRGIEQVPGSYFLARHLNNAFRSVVISNEEPREAILEYAEIIDREIEKKIKEFSDQI